MSEFSLILNIVSTVVTALFELTLDIACTTMFGEDDDDNVVLYLIDVLTYGPWCE